MYRLYLVVTVFLLAAGAVWLVSCGDDDDDREDSSGDDDDDTDDDSDDDDSDDDDSDDDETSDDDIGGGFVDNGDGTATDENTGLTWQIAPSATEMTHSEALSVCEALTLADHSDWRMPTLDDFRSLIRGCVITMTGGECPANDECLNLDCWDSICTDCDLNMGPDGGCYWPEPLEGVCDSYWTSIILDGGNSSWIVWFKNAGIYTEVTFETNFVRCVRP